MLYIFNIMFNYYPYSYYVMFCLLFLSTMIIIKSKIKKGTFFLNTFWGYMYFLSLGLGILALLSTTLINMGEVGPAVVIFWTIINSVSFILMGMQYIIYFIAGNR